MLKAIIFDLDGTLYPGRRVSELIERLSRSHALAVLSNGSSARQRPKLRALGRCVDRFAAVLISEEIGCHKPQRHAFELALDALGAAPEATLMVGNDPAFDLAPARRLGCLTCLVGTPRHRARFDATWRVNDVTELTEVLPCSTPVR